MIPFFVVDRPVSLEILKGLFFRLPGKIMGLMTHAYTSRRFKFRFARFPYGTRAKYANETEPDDKIRSRIVKFVDSGIFAKNRRISYSHLFGEYNNMDADYGAIIDFFHDPDLTLESARAAIRAYRRGRYNFNLVGVVQGRTLDDYLRSYEALLNMGYRYIAIGGMLKRSGKSNFLGVRKDGCCEVSTVISEIKKRFRPEWIFVFGILSPKRLRMLKNLGVWGADYKGWLYHYEEDYSFIVDYLRKGDYGLSYEDMEEILSLLNTYAEYKKRGFRTIYNLNDESREMGRILKEMKRRMDDILSKYGLSLQFFRFMRVRDNLYEIFKNA